MLNPYGFKADSLIIDLDKIRIAKKAHIIDSVFRQVQKKGFFNGCILYAEKGRVIYKRAFGYSDINRKEPLTTTSSFQLASVSKMFTAMAIMILKEEGKLDYDKDVRTYIPELPYENITIRNLLNHRSGVPRYENLAEEKWDPRKPLRDEDMIDLFVQYEPKCYYKPDGGFSYCNTNYALLACVVERVTGKSFDKFVKERIFDPLGMDHTFIYNMNGDSVVPEYVPVNVQGYRLRRWKPCQEPNNCLNGVMGDKNVYSCVEDLYKWDQALYNNQLVSEETLKEAFTPGSPRHRKKSENYGFGWRIRGDEDSTVYHFGWWKGFRSNFIRDLEQQKTIIVLSNVDRTPPSSYLWDIIHDNRYDLGYICDYPKVSVKKKKR
jgi:CubicO group peptidase (beta-lactamase class C family)